MNENSIIAWRNLDMGTRRAAIVRTYVLRGALTDRQLLKDLGLPDMNCVRPRVTELVDDGVIREVGSVVDAITGRQVRICAIIPAQLELAM